MKVISWDRLKPGEIQASAFTIGAFDGVHLGHREIFKQLIKHAKKRDLIPVAITFQPLPREVFNKKPSALAILSFEERKRRIESCGIEILLVVNFTKSFAQKSAPEFMEEVREKLKPGLLVVGHDFKFGRGKSAGEAWLKKYCAQHQIGLKVVDAVIKGGKPVSSSRIRALLKAGELMKANQLLGEPYQLEGKVVSGHRRGKTLGVPTANLSWKKELLVPTGVYVAWANLEERRLPAVVNIGFNPTFGDQRLSLEAHLIGFSEEVYGKNLSLILLKRLREEIKFPHPEALKRQIEKDLREAKAFLKIK